MDLMRGNRFLKFLDFWVGVPLTMILAVFMRRNRGVELPSRKYDRILVVKLAALGDAVLIIPALRSLRESFPHAEIAVLAARFTEPFLRDFPEYVNKFLIVEPRLFFRRPRYLFDLLRNLRALDCDLAIDFEQWVRITPVLLALAKIPFRLGYRSKHQYRHFLFTHSVERSSDIHVVDNFLRLSGMVGRKGTSTALETKVDPNALQRVRKDLIQRGWNERCTLIVLHPGCGIHGFPREWPPPFFANLAMRLTQNRDAFFVISGTSEEIPVLDQVHKLFSQSAILFVIPDHTDFIALLSLSSLFVSGNNGAMHLAASLQVSQVALHGPTDPKRWGPMNPNAVVIQSRCPGCPCLDLGFEYHRKDGYCMKQIDVEEVYRACTMLLEKFSR